MRLIFLRFFQIGVLATAVLSLAACSNKKSNNADLRSLTLTDAVLVPAFDVDTTMYRTEVGFVVDATSVRAVASSSKARIRVNGVAVESGATTASLPLAVGDNTITTAVTAENGRVRNYVVTVNRAPEDEATNSSLASLEIEGATLTPAFASAVTSYTADIGFSSANAVITAAAASNLATLEINGTAALSGVPADEAIEVGANVIETIVTAQNSETTTYTVTLTRADPALDDLALSLTELDQVFQPDVTSYTATSGRLGGATRVRAATIASDAVLSVNATPAEPGVPSSAVVLDAGANSLVVEIGTVASPVTTEYTVDVTQLDSSLFAQRAYVKASNTNTGDRFAAVAITGDTMVVGAPFEASNATGVNGDQADNSLQGAGAAYVFVREAGVWRQDAYLKASNTNADDRFGAFVAASEDMLAIGAPGEQSLATGVNADQDDNSGTDVGAVYVFARDATGVWQQHSYLKASNADSGDEFGRVALDGDRLVVGALGEDSGAVGVGGNQNDNSQLDAGAAYVFELDDNDQWQQAAYLKASNSTAGDAFGRVAVGGDTVAVGAAGEDSAATGINQDDTDNSAVDSGAVFTFVYDDADGWQPDAYVKASNPDPADAFAQPAIDGDLLIVGAPGEDSASRQINGVQSDNSAIDSGAAYVFGRTADIWSQRAYVKASNADPGDEFGRAVSLWTSVFVVGAPSEQSAAAGIGGDQVDNSLANAGAAYAFELTSSAQWQQFFYVKASNANGNDFYGDFVAVDRDTLAVGAAFESSDAIGIDGDQVNENALDAGAVYVFD